MLLQIALATLLGAVLLVSSGLKLCDRTGTAIAAATYGIHGRPARWIWLPLAVLEASIAAGLIAGATVAAWAAATLLAAFAVAQASALAAGRGGAPCGCFGARGQVSWTSAARAAALAGTAALLALAPAVTTAMAVHVAAGALALLLAAVVVQRGRRGSVPDGALEIAGEGPSSAPRSTSASALTRARARLYSRCSAPRAVVCAARCDPTPSVWAP